VVLGEAVDVKRAAAQVILEPSISITLLGAAKTLTETSANTVLVFAITFFIVFLVLAAQFESLTSSLVIMITV
jgi:hydrophobic/amphiphilic exporter-1 (mainly G- bacteria), HAE1 family